MVIRRYGFVLLAVLLAMGALSGVLSVTAQGPVVYYSVSGSFSGGVHYFTGGGNMVAHSCQWNTGNSSAWSCYGKFGRMYYTGYSGIQSLIPVDPGVISTSIVGWYIDVTLSGTANSVYWGSDWYGLPVSQSRRLCILSNQRVDPGIHTQAAVFADLGCSAVKTGHTTMLSPATIALRLGDLQEGTATFSNFNYVSLEEPEETQMPGTHPGGGAASCVFTTTLTFSNTEQLTTTLGITSTDGITITGDITGDGGITATIPYTREANLAKNFSFESAGSSGGPDNWQQVKDGAFINTSWVAWWNSAEDYAHTGSRAINTGAPFDLFQDVSLFGSDSSYAVGIHARCLADNCGGSVAVYWSPLFFGSIGGLTGSPKAAGSINSTEYTFISGTHTAGGGVANIYIRGLGSGAVIDDFYIYPTDEDGNVRCDDPGLYEPGPGQPGGPGGPPGDGGGGPPGYGTSPIGGIPAPIGGAGAACYNCFTPRDVSASAVSYWVAWLGCVVRNMFSCSLRIWLLIVGNWTFGVIQIGLAFMQWVPATMQAFVNWIAVQVVPGVRSTISVTVESGTNFWDVMVAWIGLIQTLLSGLFSLMLQAMILFGGLIGMLADMLLNLVKLLIDLVTAIRLSFAVEPIDFDLNGTTSPNPGGGGGPTDGKILWLFLAFLGLIDQAVIGGFAAFFGLALAALAVGVILWTLNFWRDLLSF